MQDVVEQGACNVIVDTECKDKRIYYVGSATDNPIRLNFVGRVCTEPHEGSVAVCTALGTTFYADCYGLRGAGGDFTVPAWSVGVTAPPPKAAPAAKAKSKAKHVASLELVPSVVPKTISFQYQVGAAVTNVDVTVEFLRLTLPPANQCMVLNAAEPVLLTRPKVMQHFVDKEALVHIQNASKAALAAAGRATPSGTKQPPKVKASLKHLYT